ncbi:DNA repair protein XRCC4 [Nibea albiflora]|uniref:DNA repair protein XRCC4 n=1 Tax=Nibea albiflora TaxID=240163 RepID=A0ACB7FD98_NIBAL|nr:DNA repair protein XRCC4 [Nibea albiflora]
MEVLSEEMEVLSEEMEVLSEEMEVCPECTGGRARRQHLWMHTAVREVNVSSEPDSSYFLRVDWRGRGLASGFQLLLTDGQDAWRGDVSAAAVCAEAEELEMQTERYTQDLQQALTDTESSVTYSFSLTPSPPDRSSTVTLAYEKVQKDISLIVDFRADGARDVSCRRAPSEVEVM